MDDSSSRAPHPDDQPSREWLADAIRSACRLEVLARKPGNVHPEESFSDLTVDHFLRSADVIAPVIARAGESGVGHVILEAVQATSQQVGTNTNLGIILLLAPLAAVPLQQSSKDGISEVLNGLDARDTALIYEAIRCANPGGLGRVDEHDVAEAPQISILEAMALAAERDTIARQYVRSFEEVLVSGRNVFLDSLTRGSDWEQAIIRTQLWLMSTFPDSLIARKCGPAIAKESQRRAAQLWDADWPFAKHSEALLGQFDQWLRHDGHRRNPGTTADLIAAVLFGVIRDRLWTPPSVV